MKKIIFLLATVFTLSTSMQTAQAQTTAGNPWDGPRFSSIKAEVAVWNWIEVNGYMPKEDGEWVATDWTYIGKSSWLVVVSWGTGGYIGGTETGSETLIVKNNGTITVVEE